MLASDRCCPIVGLFIMAAAPSSPPSLAAVLGDTRAGRERAVKSTPEEKVLFLLPDMRRILEK